MATNILILRSAASGDNDVKTGVATTEVENGYAVALGEVSTDRETRNAFKVAAPTEGKDLIGLVYNADVPSLTDGMGNVFKGITSDPRTIKFESGTPFNIYMPSIGDEIAMTEISGEATGAKYVIYKAGDSKPTYSTDGTDGLLTFKITGKKYVSVGAERVPTVELIAVPNVA